MLEPIPVLLYHSVPRGSGTDALSVPFERFRSHVEVIRACGRTPISVGELADGLRGTAVLPERAVLVTFDDGHANNRAAVELLGENALPATVFVTTGGLESHGMLSRRDLSELAGWAHVEVGAHTVNHPRLDELKLAEARAEVTSSRVYLQDLLGVEVLSFAYPYGAYDRRVRGIVEEAGFGSAVAVKNALSHRADDPLAIARWTVRGDTSARCLEAVLAGDGVPLAWRRERLRTRGYRGARRLRRRVVGEVNP